jgi:hypothetical protein
MHGDPVSAWNLQRSKHCYGRYILKDEKNQIVKMAYFEEQQVYIRRETGSKPMPTTRMMIHPHVLSNGLREEKSTRRTKTMNKKEK